VRQVSQELAPSPVFRGGLERALDRLAEEVAESAPVDIVVDYEAPAGVSRESAAAIYDAIAASVKAAVLMGGASEVEIVVRHKSNISAKITDNGKSTGRARALGLARLLAEQSGLKLDINPGKSTIVSIRAYALRRAIG
jgi:signal transduction histidine kinase